MSDVVNINEYRSQKIEIEYYREVCRERGLDPTDENLALIMEELPTHDDSIAYLKALEQSGLSKVINEDNLLNLITDDIPMLFTSYEPKKIRLGFPDRILEITVNEIGSLETSIILDE